ncbi:hypothetical protein LSH36_200g02033 [Paralvinella palmiformis]|uniref:CUB domain-containing protein n=1 Tax=Paralvinella palmiformis TaxID=53620 RepID=A0AAD9JR10_9ANNE|nr:hypothetical protein LSH36_200g02033 [Paralvinella palmiformis]
MNNAFIQRHVVDTKDVCSGHTFSASCRPAEVIVMEHSELGRMEPGKCIPVNRGHFGCKDDVLHLTDGWCSGRQSCEFYVPNKELIEAKINCIDMDVYFKAVYSCVEASGVNSGRCSTNEARSLTSEKGVITSLLSKKIRCGANSSPWIIEAKAGQTVEISLLDFTALSRQGSHSLVTCSDTYGYIVERTLNINHTICGQQERRHVVYKSKTNKVEVYVSTRNGANFILEYKAASDNEDIPDNRTGLDFSTMVVVAGIIDNRMTNEQYHSVSSSNVAEGQDDYLEPKSDSNTPNPTIKHEEPLIHIWETPLPDPTKPQTDQSSRTCTIHRTMQPGEKHLRTLTGGEMTSSGKPVVGSYYSPQTGHKYYVLGPDGGK